MHRLELQRDEHIKYLNEGLKQLGPSFVVLDSRFARLLFLSFVIIFFIILSNLILLYNIAVDLGFVTGSYIPWLCWGSLLITISKIMPLTFLIVARYYFLLFFF